MTMGGAAAGPAADSRHLARRGPSARRQGLYPLQPQSLSEEIIVDLDGRSRRLLARDVCNARNALNYMHGEGTRAPVSSPGANGGKASELQRLTQQRLERCALEHMRTGSADSPQECSRNLLGGRSLYAHMATPRFPCLQEYRVHLCLGAFCRGRKRSYLKGSRKKC